MSNEKKDKRHHAYALKIPLDLAGEIAAAQVKTGLSVNQIVVLSVRKYLPGIVDSLLPASKHPTGKATA